jgi:bidirectional [NiFe] hydrogenase diaphorase subunit
MLPDELRKVVVAEQEKQGQFQRRVEVCVAAGCLSLHSDRLKDALAKELKQRQQEKKCGVVGVGCMGLCSAGPLICVRPEGVVYRATFLRMTRPT